MKNAVLVIIFSIFLLSCGTSHSAKKYTYKKPVSSKTANIKKLNSVYSGNVSGKRAAVVTDAENYLGTPYKYAGNTKAGFDCSGLVCKVFDENNMKLPRRSQDQAKAGDAVEISRVKQFHVSGADRALTEIKNKNNDLVKETISYYQTASERYKNGKMKER